MTSIKMGNDEFILYIRKNTKSTKTNDILGKEIWNFIRREDSNARIINTSQPCLWGNSGSFIADDNLPKTATQFEFNILILPDLYKFLMTL